MFDAIKRVKDGTFKGGIYSVRPRGGRRRLRLRRTNRALIPDSVRARVERAQRRRSSPGASRCPARDEPRADRRFRLGRASTSASARRGQPRRVARGRAGRDPRARRRERRRQVDAHARAGRSCTRRRRTVEVNGRDVTGWSTARGDRRRRRHGAPALHARPDAHRGRERGARARADARTASLDRARAARERESAVARETGLVVEPAPAVADLTVGEAQRVEILKVALPRREDPDPRRADRRAVAARGARAVGGAAPLAGQGRHGRAHHAQARRGRSRSPTPSP